MYLAHKNGYFKEELAPMEVKGKKEKEPFVADEHPRETTFEKLQQLKPVFKENGVVTAGNASVSGLLHDTMFDSYIPRVFVMVLEQ